MDELTLLRQFAVDEPMADDAARAEVWRRLHEGQTRGRPRMRHRNGGRIAVAVAILVGALLVTPGFGLGSRLLELIVDKPTAGDVQTPSWSPDGRKLAFVSQRDGNSEIYTMNADGSAQKNLTRQPANDSHPSWSPDGRKIVFVSRRDGNSEISVMNADGSRQHKVTRTPSTYLDPAWSPGGRAIAFIKKVQTKCAPRCDYATYLYVVNADGSGLQQLTTHQAHQFTLSWSPDGKTIRFGRYLVRADGTGQTRLPKNVPLTATWSPDGQKIAYAVFPHSPRDRADLGLWVMNADGSNRRRVARTAFWTNPAWSPDGRWIAFRKFDGQYMGWKGSAGNSNLFVVNPDGSGLRRLTRNESNVRWFAWSPDGRTIAFLREGEVYIVKADGTGERKLTRLNG